MISIKEFDLLSNQDKQAYLLRMFSQLWSVKPEATDVIDLLESWYEFSTQTLDSIFTSMCNAIQEGKNTNTDKIQNQLHVIHEQLEKEASESSDEADDMLDTI